MEKLVYRRATIDDTDALVALRAAFLGEVSEALPSDPLLLDALTLYFKRTLRTGEFVAYLAVLDDHIIGSSGLVYHRHPPSLANLHGCEAYVMNMYTLPAWRGRGIATALLHKLIEHAEQNKCCRVSLHALAKARSIYLRAGFIPNDTVMQLDLRANPCETDSRSS